MLSVMLSHGVRFKKRRMPTNIPSTPYLEGRNLQYLGVTFYVSPSLQNGLRYPYLSPSTRHIQYEAPHQHPETKAITHHAMGHENPKLS